MHVTPSNVFKRILRSEALVYKSSFFFRTAVLRKLLDIRFSYNHCNFSRVCLLVKMASKTVIFEVKQNYQALFVFRPGTVMSFFPNFNYNSAVC